MGYNDSMQRERDRITRCEIYDIDWAQVREMKIMDIRDLCALSCGVDPASAWLTRDMSQAEMTSLPIPKGMVELVAKRDAVLSEWLRRWRVAENHIEAGTLPAKVSHPGSKSRVKITDFTAWADGLEWKLPDEFPRAKKALQAGGSKWPWGDYETELLRLMAEVTTHLWSSYDPSDRDTAPTNAQVSGWLKKKGVSERTADVIASILRADGLPQGRRRD